MRFSFLSRDDATAELVRIRDRQLIERFGYAFEQASIVQKTEHKPSLEEFQNQFRN
jgi:hypothetical protein